MILRRVNNVEFLTKAFSLKYEPAYSFFLISQFSWHIEREHDDKNLLDFFYILYKLRILNDEDLQREVFDDEIRIMKSFPLCYIFKDQNFVVIHKNKIIPDIFPKEFRIFFNRPKTFFNSIFPKLLYTDPTVYFLANMYRYAVGLKPKKLTFYSIVNAIYGGKELNYDGLPEFKLASTFVRPTVNNSYYYFSPFDLFVDLQTNRDARYGKAMGPFFTFLFLHVKELIRDKIVSSFATENVAYFITLLLRTALVAGGERFYCHSNKEDFIAELKNSIKPMEKIDGMKLTKIYISLTQIENFNNYDLIHYVQADIRQYILGTLLLSYITNPTEETLAPLLEAYVNLPESFDLQQERIIIDTVIHLVDDLFETKNRTVFWLVKGRQNVVN